SLDERLQFPIGKESPDATEYRGIFYSKKEYQRYSGQNTFATLIYNRSDQGSFVIHCWNIFSTLHLVQECLKRFGNPGDKFKLVYREKGSFDAGDVELANEEEEDATAEGAVLRNKYSQTLIDSKNIIFRGAPGTGKTYLARQIAADIISEGRTQDFTELEDDEKRQVGFVQFHPSYDYSDFVEGLRPRINDDGTMGFELQDGI
ncbi:ATPase, partial [Actinomyces sp. S6-Spd3]